MDKPMEDALWTVGDLIYRCGYEDALTKAIDTIHATLYTFFDQNTTEEEPFTEKDKLILDINKAVCTNIKKLKELKNV